MPEESDALVPQEGFADTSDPEIGAPGVEALEPEPPQREYLELDDDLAGRYVRTKVDGEDTEITLSEALAGYSRTADYTRKTQELAQQRQEAQFALTLQRALEANPAETLRILANRYGVGVEPPTQAYEPEEEIDDPYMDPVERRLIEMERRFQQREALDAERQADEQLRYAVGSLQQRYQADEDTVREVVTRAMQMRVGPEAFDLIYRGMAYERMVAEQQARDQRSAQQTTDDAARRAAAQGAAASVGAGRGANPAGTQATPPGAAERNLTLREAFELAERQLGIAQ